MNILKEANNLMDSNPDEDILWKMEARLSSLLTNKRYKIRQENQDAILDMMDRIEGK